ncbi:MAG: DUF2207 domain-containing protein, partial [bacterium]
MHLSRIVLVLVLGLMLGAGSPTSGAAKSYTVDRIGVNASVRPDGSMAVTEEITYSFDGSFTFAYRDIPVSAGMRVTGIAVAEGGRPYEESPGDEPGTFYVTETNGVMKVTWHCAARNETRSFRLSYVVEGAVRRYEDTAELYYQFVGDEWDHPIG